MTFLFEPSFISFEARAGSPEEAARAAQAWAETYIQLRHERDASELLQTISTLESSLDALEEERGEQLVAIEAIDGALQSATDSADISRLSTQRLVLLQSLEPALAPLDAQVDVVSGELAELHLVADFLSSEELSARINRTAEVPSGPVSPSMPRNVLLALVAGGLLGLVVIVVAEALDDRARASDEVVDRLGVTCLATVPMERESRQPAQVLAGPVVESFYRLASAIDFAAITGTAPKVIMCTSARESESKTTTISRLGVTLARQGRRTLVIGADLRRPTLSKRFGIDSGMGLGEVLGGVCEARSVIQTVDGLPTLEVLRAGAVLDGASPVDLLRSPRFAEVIDGLRNDYDHILIDCPPVLPVVDALEVARLSDGIIMTVFAGRSRLGSVAKAQQMIEQASNAPLLGFVLTGATKTAEGYGYTNSYYEVAQPRPRFVDIRPQSNRANGEPSSAPVESQVDGPHAISSTEVGFGGEDR